MHCSGDTNDIIMQYSQTVAKGIHSSGHNVREGVREREGEMITEAL